MKSPFRSWPLLLTGGALVTIALMLALWRVSRVDAHVQTRPVPDQVGPAPDAHLQVLTLNLWHDWPFHRRLDARLEQVAATIDREQANIVCLQEVPNATDFPDTARRLADRLGMAYAYGRANGDRTTIGFEEGVAILSRYPLQSPQLIEMEPRVSPFEHRVVLRAFAETSAGQVAVYCAHLTTSRRANPEQVSWLRQFVSEDAGSRTAIIAGDFNAAGDSSQIRMLAGRWLDTFRVANPLDDGHTFTLVLPVVGTLLSHRIDYVFLSPGRSGGEVVGSRRLFVDGEGPSDHLAVLTTLALGPIPVGSNDAPGASHPSLPPRPAGTGYEKRRNAGGNPRVRPEPGPG